jgi:hypothetical protein
VVVEVVEEALEADEDEAKKWYLAMDSLFWKEMFEHNLISFDIGLFHESIVPRGGDVQKQLKDFFHHGDNKLILSFFFFHFRLILELVVIIIIIDKMFEKASIDVGEYILNFLFIELLALKLCFFYLLVETVDEFAADLEIDLMVEFGDVLGVF